MKVILLENVRKVGSIGEIIDVKRGFARNFLIAKKKALFASKENIKEVEKIKNELSKKDQEKKNSAKTIDERLKNKEPVIVNERMALLYNMCKKGVDYEKASKALEKLPDVIDEVKKQEKSLDQLHQLNISETEIDKKTKEMESDLQEQELLMK